MCVAISFRPSAGAKTRLQDLRRTSAGAVPRRFRFLPSRETPGNTPLDARAPLRDSLILPQSLAPDAPI